MDGGTPFGRYRLIELLGRGGMGEVWRSHDTSIDRVVALKMLLPHFAQDKSFEKRFLREARAAASLDDPHIVPIYDVGEIEGRLYLTMRLIKGQDLQTLLDEGSLEPERAVRIIEQVASALHTAHDVGLVHRDVKPKNVLITATDFAYLIDFGIVRAIGETGLTSTGLTIGTWSYMAPERFRTGEVGPSSDIYALGCVLYQCLTGRLPFPGDTFEQVGMAHISATPPRPSVQRDDIPKALDDVVARGLAKDPKRRYQTALELAAAAAATTKPMSTDTVLAGTIHPTLPATEPTKVGDTPGQEAQTAKTAADATRRREEAAAAADTKLAAQARQRRQVVGAQASRRQIQPSIARNPYVYWAGLVFLIIIILAVVSAIASSDNNDPPQSRSSNSSTATSLTNTSASAPTTASSDLQGLMSTCRMVSTQATWH